jgi:hypothetical protein
MEIVLIPTDHYFSEKFDQNCFFRYFFDKKITGILPNLTHTATAVVGGFKIKKISDQIPKDH